MPASEDRSPGSGGCLFDRVLAEEFSSRKRDVIVFPNQNIVWGRNPVGIGMTVLPSILLAIIALIGAWIALQQMLIARAKLNIDLFDRRFAVYIATRKYIVAMLQHTGGTQEDAVAWWAVASAAPFLFDKEIASFLDEVNKRGMGMRARVGDKAIHKSKEHVGQYNEYFMWFAKNIDLLEGIFQKDMNLFKLSPFSVKHVWRASQLPAQSGDKK